MLFLWKNQLTIGNYFTEVKKENAQTFKYRWRTDTLFYWIIITIIIKIFKWILICHSKKRKWNGIWFVFRNKRNSEMWSLQIGRNIGESFIYLSILSYHRFALLNSVKLKRVNISNIGLWHPPKSKSIMRKKRQYSNATTIYFIEIRKTNSFLFMFLRAESHLDHFEIKDSKEKRKK